MEKEIREYALEIGFDDVGYTSAEPFDQLSNALVERISGYSWITDDLMQLARIADPRYVLPSAKSVVVMIYDYFKLAYPEELNGLIGKAYQSRLYPGKKRLFGSRIRLMKEYLESKGMEVGMRPAMADRQSAVRAGVGKFGCNTFVFAPGRGSFVAIIAMAVGRELEPTGTNRHEKQTTCPDGCNRCLEACPTGALYEPFKMNPLRCIAFNTYGTGNFPGAPEDIPFDIREKMGSWLYGCDICQDVCPQNQRRLKAKLVPDAFLEEIAPKFAPEILLNMDDHYYFETVQQLLYGYFWEKKFLQRNAAIALGNKMDRTAVEYLSKSVRDPESMVRQYSCWALGRLGGMKSKKLLEEILAVEESDRVREEILLALENC
jgi:epoxyqueuosine reductase